MLPHFCTFLRSRTYQAGTLQQIQKCTGIRRDILAERRNFCVKLDRLIETKPSALSATILPRRGYESTVPKNTENNPDRKDAEINECVPVKGNETIVAVPGLSGDRKHSIITEYNDLEPPDALDECAEDVSHVGPLQEPARNFAYIAETSKTVQELIKLGVKLYRLEKKYDTFRGIAELDFDYAVKPRIQFLCDNGVSPENLGDVITKCPQVLLANLEAFKHKIKYLEKHKFTKKMISTMLTKRPNVLTLTIKKLDQRLGFLQNTFELTGDELRGLVSNQPRLITCTEWVLIRANGHLMEVVKFNKDQIKTLIRSRPSVWVKSMKLIMDTCLYAMEEMKLTHNDIVNNSKILVAKRPKLESRHRFLVELKKAQYDPKSPGYIALSQLVSGTDEDFCRDVAKCDIELYNAFLKTV